MLETPVKLIPHNKENIMNIEIAKQVPSLNRLMLQAESLKWMDEEFGECDGTLTVFLPSVNESFNIDGEDYYLTVDVEAGKMQVFLNRTEHELDSSKMVWFGDTRDKISMEGWQVRIQRAADFLRETKEEYA